MVGEGLNLGWHEVVGEDHGVALGLEVLDLVTDGGGHLGCGGELRRPERRGLRRGHLDAAVAPPSSPVVAAGRAPPGFSVLRSSAIGLSRLSCGHLLPVPRDSIALAAAADKTGVKMPPRAQSSMAGGARAPCRYALRRRRRCEGVPPVHL